MFERERKKTSALLLHVLQLIEGGKRFCKYFEGLRFNSVGLRRVDSEDETICRAIGRRKLIFIGSWLVGLSNKQNTAVPDRKGHGKNRVVFSH